MRLLALYFLLSNLVTVWYYWKDWREMREREKPSDMVKWYVLCVIGIIWFIALSDLFSYCGKFWEWFDKKFAYKKP